VAVHISDKEFDLAVSEALDQVPEQFLEVLDNVVILVQDEPEGPDKHLLGLYEGIPLSERDKHLLGLYEGIPLSERDTHYGAVLPDHIFIFRGPLKRYCNSVEELVEEIGVTVVHEIAHFFGIDDEELHELGWG